MANSFEMQPGGWINCKVMRFARWPCLYVQMLQIGSHGNNLTQVLVFNHWIAFATRKTKQRAELNTLTW